MCFKCGLEDHWITYYLKPENSENNFHWNTEKTKNSAYILTNIYITSDNSIEQNDSQKIYASMAHMSSHEEIPRRDFGDSLQLTN